MATANGSGESNANQVVIPCIVFFALTPIFIIIRLWSRIATRSTIGADDWTIMVSFVCVLVVQILMMFSVSYGFGRHVYELETQDRLMALKLFYVAQIFYKLTINLTKASILALYLRIFVQRWFRICCYVLVSIILAYMVATTASSIFQCSPISGAWDKSSKPTCIDLTKNWYANAGFSIATDILILLLPMQPIWASKLPVNQKRALMLVFALGGFVTVTSIMRSTTLKFSTKTPDMTYDIASTLWTMIEQNVAIICACLPMCRLPLAFLFPSTFGSTSRQRSSYKYGGSNNSHNAARSNNTSNNMSSSQHSSSHSAWQPYGGPAKTGGANRSIVHHSDDMSEEYILTSVKRQGSEDEGDGDGDAGAIRKTTRYEISYEREPSR
ncbi:hypothetical protein VD0002_g6124 [Verticillium dahliae]|uniref:Integral membrane protein n=2 Tax=Verticillium dahliae TaxID=27337 RepID=G2X060_VERDV|nr:uncharacterized protein VDAG_03083 [Verticillium dahliae VdLs.17]KAF3344948.1 hypothetical protein VdG2_07134 [Verticillium dahliae VDG2]KAH6703457.1 integral membrane protein [Verticillium dahliae]EGY21643.1 integral membrane protein [Verticillium dahliae VdLs.17]PNH29138.1 hypothetical protein BJF96_g7482 [Verticillium dahliae]PNH40228.1 hypothetical protein VD0004_g6726 [Verticillium dahliae]